MDAKKTLVKTAQFTNIDYKKYRTEDLKSTISEILNISGNVAFFAKIFVPIWVIGPIIVPILFFNCNICVKFVWSMYGALCFFFIAAGVAVFFIQSRILKNSLKIVDIIFKVSLKVLNDLSNVGENGIVETAIALVSNVNNSVIQPIIEGLFHAKLGVFSSPVLWIYKGTIGKIMNFVEKTVKKIASSQDNNIQDSDNSNNLKTKSKGLVKHAGDTTLKLKVFMNKAHENSMKTSLKLTKLSLLPSLMFTLTATYITFFIVVLVKVVF